MSVTRLLQLQASRLGIAGASFGRLKSLKEATSKLSSALESLQPLPDDQQADTAAVTFLLACVSDMCMGTCSTMQLLSEHLGAT